MKNLIHFPQRALVVCFWAVALTGHGQTNPVNPVRSIPDRPVVTEGRSVSMYADGAVGAVQWQVSSGPNQAWGNVTDNATYHGANTRAFEITGATKELNNLLFRFTDTADGSVATSNVARLAVRSLLFPSATGNSTIRAITADGIVSTYAGIPTVAGLRDDPARNNHDRYAHALFNQPRALECDPDRGILYVADTGNAVIRMILPNYGGVQTLTLAQWTNESDGSGLPPFTTPDSGGSGSAGTGASDGGSGGGSMGGGLVAALAGAWLLRKLAEGFPRRVRLRGPVGV